MKWAAGAAFPPAAIASRETSMHQYPSSSIVDLGWCRTFPIFPPKSKTLFPFQFGLRSWVSKYTNCPSLLVMNDIGLILRGASRPAGAFRQRFFLSDQRQHLAAKANHLGELGPAGKNELRNARVTVFHECSGDFRRRADQSDRRRAKIA